MKKKAETIHVYDKGKDIVYSGKFGNAKLTGINIEYDMCFQAMRYIHLE